MNVESVLSIPPRDIVYRNDGTYIIIDDIFSHEVDPHGQTHKMPETMRRLSEKDRKELFKLAKKGITPGVIGRIKEGN